MLGRTRIFLLNAQVISFIAFGRASHHYPDPLTARLEHLLVDSAGYNNGWFYRGVTPCSNYVSAAATNTGRSTAGQWMRVAFHDFSTADVSAGTGGLDSSIVFEYTRAENSGQAFPDSFSYWQDFMNAEVSCELRRPASTQS